MMLSEISFGISVISFGISVYAWRRADHALGVASSAWRHSIPEPINLSPPREEIDLRFHLLQMARDGATSVDIETALDLWRFSHGRAAPAKSEAAA